MPEVGSGRNERRAYRFAAIGTIHCFVIIIMPRRQHAVNAAYCCGVVCLLDTRPSRAKTDELQVSRLGRRIDLCGPAMRPFATSTASPCFLTPGITLVTTTAREQACEHG